MQLIAPQEARSGDPLDIAATSDEIVICDPVMTLLSATAIVETFGNGCVDPLAELLKGC